MRRQAGVTVIGEAIVDLIPAGPPRTFQAVPGGSPYNVAIGLARLGHHATLMARLADTAFGRILRDHAQAEGVDLHAAPSAAEPATLAVVSLDAAGPGQLRLLPPRHRGLAVDGRGDRPRARAERGAALRIDRVLDAAG